MALDVACGEMLYFICLGVDFCLKYKIHYTFNDNISGKKKEEEEEKEKIKVNVCFNCEIIWFQKMLKYMYEDREGERYILLVKTPRMEMKDF